MGQESACPETSYWKVVKTAVDGGQTCSPPDAGQSRGCLSFMRGAQPTNSQPLPAPGFGLAVVQLAGAVDYPGPALFLRQPRV